MTDPEYDSVEASKRQIKFSIENGLDLAGHRPATGHVKKVVDSVFRAVIKKQNEMALYILLTEIQQQPDDWWNAPQEFYDD
jgi:hypothetical protein